MQPASVANARHALPPFGGCRCVAHARSSGYASASALLRARVHGPPPDQGTRALGTRCAAAGPTLPGWAHAAAPPHRLAAHAWRSQRTQVACQVHVAVCHQNWLLARICQVVLGLRCASYQLTARVRRIPGHTLFRVPVLWCTATRIPAGFCSLLTL